MPRAALAVAILALEVLELFDDVIATVLLDGAVAAAVPASVELCR
jgi:hypothetical protein